MNSVGLLCFHLHSPFQRTFIYVDVLGYCLFSPFLVPFPPSLFLFLVVLFWSQILLAARLAYRNVHNFPLVNGIDSSRKMLACRVKVNAGGKVFETFAQTLLKYPKTTFGKIIHAALLPRSGARQKTAVVKRHKEMREVFLDVDPRVFEIILQFFRSGKMQLPTQDEILRLAVVWQLEEWQLKDAAFPPSPLEAHSNPNTVLLPDMLVVQMCDHMQADQGVKRHAVTITYGSDGFLLKTLCKEVRKDLTKLLSTTFWQVYQTNERAAFFVSTRLSNGSADLLMTSVSQKVVEHTELMGYKLETSYVTLSPDVEHTSVRLFIHYFIFRRVRAPSLEAPDEIMVMQQSERADGADPIKPNFMPPDIGPQPPARSPLVVPRSEKVEKIWDE